MNFFGSEPRFYMGDVVYNAFGRCGPRTQTNLQLVYVYTGEVTVWVDGVERHLGEREVTLLVPGHREDFRFSTTGQTHHGWCEVIGAKLEPSVRDLYENLRTVWPFNERMMQLAEIGLSLRADPMPSVPPLHDTLAQAVFFEFFRQAGLLTMQTPPIPEPVQRARRHIDQHHAQPCHLDLLGKVAGVTPSPLIRLFRRHLAVTPIEYLWRTRVESARRLLVESGLSIGEIAYRTGFQSPYHFSRLARKHLGRSPRQYRQAAWSAAPGKKRSG